MLVRIGDLWSEQRLVASPEHEVETFNNLRIDRVTTQLLKVGHSDEQGNFLLPAAEHPWHMANTHSYCVRVDLGDGRSLVVPSMELARFYFGSSSRLLAALFLPPFDPNKLYSGLRSVDFFDEDYELDLVDGVPEASGPDIARLAISKPAANAAAMVGTSLLHARAQGAMDIYPKCVFPFEGTTTIKASGQWLSLGGQPQSTFLVYRLRSCSHPFPFENLKVQASGSKRRSSQPAATNSAAASARRRAGAPDANNQTLRERDASGNLAPRIRRELLREVKFPDLRNKSVWSEAKLAVDAESLAGSPGATAVADIAVGDAGSVQRIRSITIVEALGRSDGPPTFLLPAIERFKRLKRLEVMLLTASIDDGWTVPIPYTISEDGEIPRQVLIEEGGTSHIRRVAAFRITGGWRQAHIVIKESSEGAIYVDRAFGGPSVPVLLEEACGMAVVAD
jgi:hypothetical protein